MPYISTTLAEYIGELSFVDLPPNAIGMVKLCIRDSIGCSLAGSTTEIGKILINTLIGLGGGGNSTIMGHGAKTTAPYAAFVNGSTADILELNDIFKGHMGATIIAPAVALAEGNGVTGKELITACSLGYEICARVADAFAPRPNPKLFGHGFGTYQTFAAVTAAAKILKLSKGEIVNALGIAGSNAPLPCNMKTVEGDLGNSSMVKNNFGTASMIGALSALLAKKGFTGPPDIFEGDTGFWKMYGSDRCELEKLVDQLGTQYLVLDMGFKAYSACGATHGAIDAVTRIKHHTDISADDVEAITVKVPTPMAKMPWSNPNVPKTMYEAQFNTAYIVAINLIGLAGPPGPGWYTEDKLRDPKVAFYMAKIKVEADAECDDLRFKGILLTKVNIETRKGSYQERIEFAKGHNRNPISELELQEKFKYLAGLALSSEKVEQLTLKLNHLEIEENIDDLTSWLY
jgi:2-methylcitrate dehydratase PrpD